MGAWLEHLTSLTSKWCCQTWWARGTQPHLVSRSRAILRTSSCLALAEVLFRETCLNASSSSALHIE